MQALAEFILAALEMFHVEADRSRTGLFQFSEALALVLVFALLVFSGLGLVVLALAFLLAGHLPPWAVALLCGVLTLAMAVLLLRLGRWKAGS